MLQTIMFYSEYLKMKVGKLIRDEKGEVNIVAIVVLIGIAVVLALFFKEQIANILKNLFQGITNKTNTVMDDI